MQIETLVKKYCKEAGITQRKLSDNLGVNHIHFNGIVKGRRPASAKLAREMEKETNGAIPAKNVRPDIFA